MKILRKPKVFCALSGGVDSSVAAALLKRRGFDVRGIHIKMWSDPSIPCLFKKDRYDAMAAAAKIGIPFETWDLSKEYKKEVVDYMVREYAAGRTPNPDVMCNKKVKFGTFLKKALERGADFVATGHYVRLRQTENNRRGKKIELLPAIDENKDQSYFLWILAQKQLKYCLFPVGEYAKPEIRKLARKFRLPNAEKPDSQGICFIGEIDVRDFLKKRIPAKPGPVLTASGKPMGQHDGLAFYTIGQRKGLGIGGGIPYYTADKDFRKNALIVAEGPYDKNLFGKKLAVKNANWISEEKPALPLRCFARIRYRQPLEKCAVRESDAPSELAVSFSRAQRAITPGQSVVFYKNGKMLGGGIIK